jgi:hypothetical protein
MSRYLYNQMVLAALESTPGTLVTTAATDAILLSGVTVKLPDEGDARNSMYGRLGNSEILPGLRPMELTFQTELAGSGTAGTAPTIGKLLRACGLAEVVTASTRVEYNPISTAFEALSFGFVNDGAKYTSRFGRGSGKFGFNVNKKPVIDWTFKAIDSSPSALANPSPNFAGQATRPQTITDYNTSSLKVGGSYSAGVVTGGTALAWESFMMDINNTVDHIPLVGTAEAIDISDRNVKGSVSAFLDAATEVTWQTDWRTSILGAFSLQHGSTAGNKIIVHGANVQKHNIQQVGSQAGKRIMNTADLEFIPTSTGNNDFLVCFL